MAAPPLGGPPRKRSGAGCGAHLSGQPDQEANVMQRQQPQPQQLLRHEQVPQVAARERAASLRSEEHTSELQSRLHLVCRLLLEKKKNTPLTISDSRSATATPFLSTTCPARSSLITPLILPIYPTSPLPTPPNRILASCAACTEP